MMVLPFVVGVFIMWNEYTKSWTSFVLNSVVLVAGVVGQRVLARHPYHAAYEPIATPQLKDLTMEY